MVISFVYIASCYKAGVSRIVVMIVTCYILYKSCDSCSYCRKNDFVG